MKAMSSDWRSEAMAMTTIVTGASGFVGLNVVEALLQNGRRVVALSHDALPAPAAHDFARLPGKLFAVQADIVAPGTLIEIFRDHDVQQAIHLAAITSGANADPRQAARMLDVNAVGTVALFEAAVAKKLRRVVYASSGAVYGDAVFGAAPIDEDTAAQPTTLYGITKLLGERLVRHYRARHGLDCVAARLSAVFGPWERDTGLRATLSAPFQLAGIAVRGGEAVLASRGVRDWIYSRDIARALVALLDAPALGHEIYNVSLGEIWNARLVAEALAAEFPAFRWREAANEAEANIAYFAALDRERRSANCARLTRELGFSLAFPPPRACADYAGWVRTHRAMFASSER